MPAVLRGGDYRPRSTTITMRPEPVAWSRIPRPDNPAMSGTHLRSAAASGVVMRGMGGAGFGRCAGGLGGKGCDSAGAQSAQALFGAGGAILSMFGASQASSASAHAGGIPTGAPKELTGGASSGGNNTTSDGSGLLAAGGIVSAVGSSWAAACDARRAANAEDNLTIPPPIAPPPAPRSQWVNGVDNTVIVAAGAAVLLGGVLLMRR